MLSLNLASVCGASELCADVSTGQNVESSVIEDMHEALRGVDLTDRERPTPIRNPGAMLFGNDAGDEHKTVATTELLATSARRVVRNNDPVILRYSRIR